MDLGGERFQVLGFRFQVSSFRFQVSGFRFQVSSFRFHVSSFRFVGLLLAFFALLLVLCILGCGFQVCGRDARLAGEAGNPRSRKLSGTRGWRPWASGFPSLHFQRDKFPLVRDLNPCTTQASGFGFNSFFHPASVVFQVSGFRLLTDH